MGTEAIPQRSAKSYKIQRGKIHQYIAVQQKHITGEKRSKETSVNSSSRLNAIHFETNRIPRNQITTTEERTEEIPETVPHPQEDTYFQETAAGRGIDTIPLRKFLTVPEIIETAVTDLQIPRNTEQNTARTRLTQRLKD